MPASAGVDFIHASVGQAGAGSTAVAMWAATRTTAAVAIAVQPRIASSNVRDNIVFASSHSTEQCTAQDDHGDAEVNDESRNVNQGSHKRRRAGGRIEAA